MMAPLCCRSFLGLVVWHVIAVWPVEASAVEPGWLGAQVLPAQPNVQLRNGDHFTATLSADSVCRVTDVEGDWLWVGTRNVQGWVHKESVLRYDDAIAVLSEKLAAAPGDRLALEIRGAARFNRGEFALAADDFTAALELEPGDAAALNNRGNCWDMLGQHDRALADYDEAIRLEPDVAMHYHNRGIAWQNKGEPLRAAADFAAAISRLEGREASIQTVEAGRQLPVARAMKATVKYRLHLANAHAAAGDYRLALADFRTAAQLDPHDAEAHNALAWLLATCPDASIRNGAAACQAAETACALGDRKVPNHLDTLAAAQAAAGDLAQAVATQTLAVDLAPDDDSSQADFRARLALYQQGRPYVAPAVRP